MKKRQELDKLTQAILNNKVCEELAVQATNLVMEGGNLDADIVFIGKAADKSEAE